MRISFAYSSVSVVVVAESDTGHLRVHGVPSVRDVRVRAALLHDGVPDSDSRSDHRSDHRTERFQELAAASPERAVT